MKKVLALLTLLLISVGVFAQNNTAGEIEMADALYADGRIYVVVAVVATIFTGIIVFLINLDRKIAKIEKQLGNHK